MSSYVSPQHTPGISRRTLLAAGAIGGGLTLANLLRAEASAGRKASHKAVINIHLDGGAPHLDTIDLKPDAPREIRGEFTSIPTKIAGFHVCELLPKLAAAADKFVFIRSLVGAVEAHDAFQCQSGFAAKDLQSIGGRPAFGSIIAKLQGGEHDVAPLFVDLMQGRPMVRNSARPGFLGPSYRPFRPDISHLFARPLEDGMKVELAARGEQHALQLTLNEALTRERLESRTNLLAKLDQMQNQLDSSGMMAAMDRFGRQAVGILTSGRLAEALDFAKEDPRVLSRYTLETSVFNEPKGTDEGASATKKFLMARRMIEAGVRCVSISLSDFDTHSDNFPRMRRLLPILDHGLTTLVDDLAERGMLEDVAIVVWGEFGRTPTIDAKTGGRHHWPAVGMCLLAGGKFHAGQVIGSTDRYAMQASSRPVHYQDVMATLYQHLGIDAAHTTIADPTGRPQYLLDHGKVIQEVV